MILGNKRRQSVLDSFNVKPANVIAVEWLNGTEPSDAADYKVYGEDQAQKTVPAEGLIIEGRRLWVEKYGASSICYQVIIETDSGMTYQQSMDGVLNLDEHVSRVIIDTENSTMSLTPKDWNFYVEGTDRTSFSPVPYLGYCGGLFDAIQAVAKDQAPNFYHVLDGMDLDYLTNHSGTKAVSNMIQMMLDQNGEEDAANPGVKVLTRADRLKVARRILAHYGDAWAKMYAALETEYAPLENYSMNEETSPDLRDEFGVSDDYEKKLHRDVNSKSTVTDHGSHTDRNIFGFNSPGSSGVPESTVNTGGTVVTEGDALDNNSDDIETQKGSRIETHSGKTTVTRSGNIGVTTSQQMLESEIQLRIAHEMHDIIMEAVDQVITTAGYAPILSEQIYLV